MSERAVTGIGVGFRFAMAKRLLHSDVPAIRWLEIHPENYVQRGGRFRHLLHQARERYPLVTHGLTLGFGATAPAEDGYVAQLRSFLREIGTPFHSEHLCFSGSGGRMVHDLLPIPFDNEAIEVATRRVVELRERLGLPLAVENISFYAHPRPPQMDEPAFLCAVAEAADAKLLLDVNNIFVNSQNHGFDPRAYVDRIPRHRVVQIHVAGHFTRDDGLIIDTHGEAVREAVYDLLEYTLRRLGPVPVLLERDQNFPPFEELVAEVQRLDEIYRRATEDHVTG